MNTTSASSPAELESILNVMTEGVIIIDPLNAVVISLNRAARDLFDFSSTEEAEQRLFIWSEFFEATYFDGRPIESSAWPIRRAFRGELFTNFEIVIRNRHAGGRSWVGSFNANPIRNSHGRVILVITVKNVTSGKRAEQALTESEENFQSMADATPAMIWMAGHDKLCTFVNREWLSFRGRTREQELGFGWTEGVHRDDIEQIFAVYNASFDERRGFTVEYRVRRWDGDYRRILVRGVPRFGSEKIFVGYVGSCLDVTTLRMAEQKTLAQANLETIGLLAGGIAHDFNNLLASIIAEVELVLADVPAGIAAEEIQKIRTAAWRGSEIVRELLVYTGQETEKIELIDIASLVREMVQLMRISVSKHIHIETTFADNVPAIQANAAQIRRVIMNLVINASEAIGNNDGTIRLGVRQDGDFVQIEVGDTGHGMDAETQAKIFDPFFTTKYAGRGRGLAIVQAIIQKHGGSIQLETALGGGTTFRISFPSATLPPADEPARAQTVPESMVRGSILIVEDEPSILFSVSRLLRRRGFSILEALDGSVAMKLIWDERNTIDVILLDMTIPGKSSHEVFVEAQRLRPNLKIILTSVYSEDVASSSPSWLFVHGYIRKPYQIDLLEQLVEQVLRSN